MKRIVLMFLASGIGCSWLYASGPLSPDDLPSSMVCIEFLIGSPPVVDTAICAGSSLALAELERDYLVEHPRTVGVRRIRP